MLRRRLILITNARPSSYHPIGAIHYANVHELSQSPCPFRLQDHLRVKNTVLFRLPHPTLSLEFIVINL